MKVPAILFLAIFPVGFIAAQSKQIHRPDGKVISTGTIDKTIMKLMDTAEVTGLCLGIVNDNKVAYVKTYGYKNAEKTAFIDTATCFYAASLAKPLFAYLVMQLVDEGVIDLDKPLYTYLPRPIPDFEPYKDLAGDERWKLITARHCLSHTTGFPNWRFLNPNNNNKLEIFFTPGSRYAYSGEGLVLLQLTIEVITGKKLEYLAQEKVFKRFGMRRTSFLWQPAFEDNYAVGFDVSGKALQKRKRASANAAGSMETTIADYTRFVAGFMQGKGLSQRSTNEMLSPQVAIYTKQQFPSLNNDTTSVNKKIHLSYGLGWGLFNTPWGPAFFKEGHDEGWEHYMISFPGKKSSFIVMTNSSNGESIFKELIEKLTGVTIPWEWEIYTPYRGTVKLPENILQQFAGTYDGRLKAVVVLEDGQLKISSETVKLPTTKLYATNDHHFFLKTMDAEIDFVRGLNGQIEKAVVDDEGEHYELKKIQ